MVKESDIKKQIRQWLTANKIYNFPIMTTGIPDGLGGFRCNPHRGISDIIGVLTINGGGHILCIEVKTNKGKLSPHQELFKWHILQSHGCYIEARSIEDVARGIEEYKKNHTKY